jgi:hypothetical protein
MRQYAIIFYLLIVGCQHGFAQQDTLSAREQFMLDSLIANDPFLQLMKNQKQKDHIYLSIGAGNGGFSTHNNAANATGYVKQLILTPAVSFISAKGFNATVTGFITNDSCRKTNVYQVGLSAGYAIDGKIMNAGMSYTRYIGTGTKYNSRNIYQNDIYGYVTKAKGWLRPGISAGFVNGTYKEWRYLTYERTIHLPNPPPYGRDTIVRSRIKDSTTNTANYFSLTASAQHQFAFYQVFSSQDAIAITPKLMLNFGSANLSQTHTNAIFDRYRVLSRYKKATLSDQFQVQSVALAVDGLFTLKHFFVQPNVYFDYYLPATQQKRLSTIFSIASGFYF